MCGIAGFVDMERRVAEGRRQLELMIHTLSHRGPDGYGFHLDDCVGLAHARLSIIDLSTGDQPIRNENGDCLVVFNGEIFNYIELRASLEVAGHRFYTRSDTEVIVHLYEEYGDNFVAHLNGQFAIALWDSTRRRLVLARDRVGIRPLFYMERGTRLWFASEVKALLAADRRAARLAPEGIAQTFCFWSAIDPQTAFQDIKSLPPGHVLTVEASGTRHTRQYWDWQFPEVGSFPAAQSIDETAMQLRGLLRDAVRLQLRADVPVGAYLSGGLDSAIIASLGIQPNGPRLRTFSVSFSDAEFDESPYQQQMADFLGTDHSTVRCRPSDIGACFPQLVYHAEAPLLRTAAAPLMLLSRAVREHGIKVVLTGEGADEVFGGYDIFKEAKIRRFWARQPASRWRPSLLGRLYGYLDNSPVDNAGMTRAFFERGLSNANGATFAHEPRWTTSASSLRFLSTGMRASLGPWTPIAWYAHQLPVTVAHISPMARDQYVEAHTLLAGYLLSSQGDRVAMANSVEGRYPFLDHRVIEFGNALPDRYKLRGLKEKYILRRAMAGMLPDNILNRIKQPYRAPDNESFFQAGQPLEYVADLMSGDRIRAAGYFDAGAVGRLLDKCRAGRVRGFANNQAFVGILSTMLLDELFVRGNTVLRSGHERPDALTHSLSTDSLVSD
ncbi:MAG: asparagine synthase (glutamine-hydrolyzing) [Pseudomonadota bacterium]